MKQYCFYALFVLFIASPLANAINFIPDICKNAIFTPKVEVEYNFCVKALGSDPRSSTASLEQLGEISFQLDITKAKLVSIAIADLLKNPKVDWFDKIALHDCLEIYSNVSKDLEKGLQLVKSKDFLQGYNQGVSASDRASACEDKFNGRRSPLAQQNADFAQLAAISSNIAWRNMHE